MRVITLALSAGLALMGGQGRAADLWEKVATADVILKAQIARSGGEGPILTLVDVQAMKGQGVGPVVYQAERHQPPIQFIRTARRTPAIFFLAKSDDTKEFYFEGPDALQASSSALEAAIRAEITNQARQLAIWRPEPRRLHAGEVRQIIDQIAASRTAERQQRLFDQLEALGAAAVPAMIDQMDDRRPLRFREIRLRNTDPNAFEGERQYGPERMVDALAAELNQITGHNFGFIMNGASEGARRASVAGWRIYAAHLGPDGKLR